MFKFSLFLTPFPATHPFIYVLLFTWVQQSLVKYGTVISLLPTLGFNNTTVIKGGKKESVCSSNSRGYNLFAFPCFLCFTLSPSPFTSAISDSLKHPLFTQQPQRPPPCCRLPPPLFRTLRATAKPLADSQGCPASLWPTARGQPGLNQNKG